MMNVSQQYQIDFYNSLNSLFRASPEIDLMNHGYYPIHEKSIGNTLLESSSSLYCYLTDKFSNVTNKKILDIGCGRGGGTKIIRKHYNFLEVAGCDINEQNINHCKLNPHNCNFFISNAENLNNIEDHSFDCVLNIESSHCYSDFEKFCKSVKRVMKNNGEFILSDVFNRKRFQHVKSLLNEHFNILEIEDITENVALSCEFVINKLETNNSKKDAHQWLLNLYREKYNEYNNRINLFNCFYLTGKNNE